MIKKLTVLFFLLSFGTQALACSCAPPESVREEAQNSDFVFKGKVIGVRFLNYQNSKYRSRFGVYEYQFEVERNYKGVKKKETVSLISEAGGGMCGYQFTEGETYLVYGYTSDRLLQKSEADPDAEYMTTSICTITKKLEKASFWEKFLLWFV